MKIKVTFIHKGVKKSEVTNQIGFVEAMAYIHSTYWESEIIKMEKVKE